MALFSNLEKTYSYYNPQNNENNDTIFYEDGTNGTTDNPGTISLHLIEPKGKDVNILNEQIAQLIANVEGDITDQIEKNAKVTDGNITIYLINNPEYKSHMNFTHLQFRKSNS